MCLWKGWLSLSPITAFAKVSNRKLKTDTQNPGEQVMGRNHIRIIPFCSTREHSLSNFDAKCFPDQHSPSYS